jgi:hypothetical protein
MINNGMATAKTLETNIGWLVHLVMAIPVVHHFMSPLQDLNSTAKQRRSVKIYGEHTKDLQLMLGFLRMANNGISLNSIAFQQSTHVFRYDSYPTGLGGYSHKGFAWHWYLPDNLKFRASNN